MPLIDSLICLLQKWLYALLQIVNGILWKLYVLALQIMADLSRPMLK